MYGGERMISMRLRIENEDNPEYAQHIVVEKYTDRSNMLVRFFNALKVFVFGE